MKLFLVLICSLATLAWIFIEGKTSSLAPAKPVSSALEFFEGSRASVGNCLEGILKNELLAVKDLDAVLAVLGAESNKLQTAAFDSKLDRAAAQVEKVQDQAAGLLKDSRNKLLATTLEPQQWMDQIVRQKAVGKILEKDLERMRTTLEELRRWASLLEPVAPPDQFANTLRTRLSELLNEWQGLKTTPGQSPRKVGNQPGLRAVNAGADASPPIMQSHRKSPPAPVGNEIQVPQVVAKVVNMAGAGIAENIVASFIDQYPWSFELNADQIIYLKDKVSSAIICRMIRHEPVAPVESRARAKVRNPSGNH